MREEWCQCGTKNLRNSKFCCQCGHPIKPRFKFDGPGYSLFSRKKGGNSSWVMITAVPTKRLKELLSSFQYLPDLPKDRELIVGLFGVEDVNQEKKTIRLRRWRPLLNKKRLGKVEPPMTIVVDNLP